MLKRYFAGVNSTEGFYSYFSCIAEMLTDAKRVIYLKGGPGTGKSTLLKRLSEQGEREELDVSVYHCSSDPGSLDGVSINESGLAVIDATAPHACDPILPGVRDEILNLGEFWDSELLRKNKREISQLEQYKKEAFQTAYAYFASIAPLYKRLGAMADFGECRNLYKTMIEPILDEIKENEANDKKGALGKRISLFAEALTPNGEVNYLETYKECRKVVVLGKGDLLENFVISHLLSDLVGRLSLMGHDSIVLMDYLSPRNKINHVIVDNMLITIKGTQDTTTESTVPEVKEINKLIKTLKRNIVEELRKARSFHVEIEEYYTKAMDFENIDIF